MSFNAGLVSLKDSANDFLDNKTKSTPVAMVAPELKQNSDNSEITKTCAVLGCDDSKNLEAEAFFRFPEEPSLKQIWTDLTGRSNWTPTDYSYICVHHFSVDCFKCDNDDSMVLQEKAVPSLKLPGHVLEVEYIDEDTLYNEDEEFDDMETDGESDYERSHTYNGAAHRKPQRKEVDLDLLNLFLEVQKMQRQAVSLKEKVRCSTKVHSRQAKHIQRLKQLVEIKKKVLNDKKKKKSRILLTLQDKIKEDANGLVLAMPTRHTDDLKNFALSIYRYSPQAYIYIRNTLRTLLPGTDVLDLWVSSGYQPRSVVSNSSLIKVTSELTDSELSCKISLG